MVKYSEWYIISEIKCWFNDPVLETFTLIQTNVNV